MRIAVLVPGLRAYDAVSNDARQMAVALRGQGHEVALFAMEAHGVDEPVLSHEALADWITSPRDVVIYHFCTAWDFPLELFRHIRARRVVRYHNVTPPGFFRGWSDGYVSACGNGRKQIAAFARLGCELYLGCSPFNLEDFAAEGVDAARMAVLAPFHPVEALAATAPDARRMPDNGGAPLLLMVGRIVPNKSYLELAEALAACVREVDGQSHLLLIGKLAPALASYGEAFWQRVDQLGLRERVTLIDDADGPTLRAAYAAATALVMLSAHEGFCVPVIEALALGTPVVAYGSSAIPWTLGDAGLIWDDRDAHLVAASVGRIYADPALREHLLERGRARYRDAFAPVVLERELAAVMRRFE